MLQIIEAVDGPLAGHYALFDPPAKGKFSNRVEQVYAKAINQAKVVFERSKMSDLLA